MESRFRFACTFAFAALAACQSHAPRPRPDLDIAAALGNEQSIVLRVEGMPIDDGDSGSTLTLEEALAAGLRNSPEIQTALARVRTALADADQARLLPNPLLEFVLRLPESGGRADVEIGVATDLLAILRRERVADSADRRLAAAVSEAVATSVSVAADVQERYATVRALDELVPLLRERRAGVERLTAVARSRMKFGEGSRIEITTLEARAVEIDLELRERESESRDERLALARRLGRPSDEAVWSLETRPTAVDSIGDETRWIWLALEHRAEIQAWRWEMAALGIETQSSRASKWQGLEIGARAERGREWSAGPAVSTPLPLFDDGSARRERAESRALEARHELTLVQRRVVEEVRRAFAAHATASTSLERVRDEMIPLQRSRLEQAGAAHRAGQVDVGVVLLAEQDLQSAQMRLVEAEKRAFVSLVRLERAVGGAGIAKHVHENDEVKP